MWAGQNVPNPKRTQQKRTHFWSKRINLYILKIMNIKYIVSVKIAKTKTYPTERYPFFVKTYLTQIYPIRINFQHSTH